MLKQGAMLANAMLLSTHWRPIWLLVTLASIGFPELGKAQQLDVYPREASGLASVELSELIVQIVPAHGFEGLEWDYLAGGPVLWSTNGIDSRESIARRDGLVRVNIKGRVATVLRQQREEQAWKIVLFSPGNPKWGPKAIGLSVQCFGSQFRDCSYSVAEVLSSPEIHATKLCTGRFNESPEVYEVRIRSKQPVLLSFEEGGGSGGIMQSLAVHPIEEVKNLCVGKSRGR